MENTLSTLILNETLIARKVEVQHFGLLTDKDEVENHFSLRFVALNGNFQPD